MTTLTQSSATDVATRDALISAMTHDLRSPIGAISIFCEIMLMGKDKLDDQQRQNLSMIMEATEKARLIIDDAAELSRLFKGSLTLHRQQVSLNELTTEAVEQFRQSAKAKTEQFEQAISTNLLVSVDSSRMRLVLFRLLEEASYYAGPETPIRITSRESPAGEIELRVESTASADTGRRPPLDSVKGRLGNRKPGDSPYSLLVCELLMREMGGSLALDTTNGFAAAVNFSPAP